MGQGESKPHWQPDEAARDCAGCKQPFTVSRRRHHCRSCGLLFCNDCSKNKTHDPDHMPPGHIDRVCQPCYDALTGTVSNRASPGGTAGANGHGGADQRASSARLNADATGGSGHAAAPSQPTRRPVVVVNEDSTGDPNATGGAGNGHGDDGGDGDGDASMEGHGSAVYEAAMNRANALLVDVRACTSKPPGSALRMTSRNIETDLKAVGGTAHLELPASADPAPVWTPHALTSLDVAATFFAVSRTLPATVVEAHVGTAVDCGMWVDPELTNATLGVPEPAPSLPGGHTAESVVLCTTVDT